MQSENVFLLAEKYFDGRTHHRQVHACTRPHACTRLKTKTNRRRFCIIIIIVIIIVVVSVSLSAANNLAGMA